MSSLTSARGQLMLGYLPPLYERSRVMRSLLQAEGAELDQLRGALDETLSQFFVRTATWGLDRWEEELGLRPAANQPISERRDRIISHLRGTGTATIAVVKGVAEAYDNGAVDVIEDHAAYTVTIRFVDAAGVPPNLDDLKAALRTVVPAHLALLYEFNYTLWQEIDARGWTWDQIDGSAPGGPAGAPLTWDKWEVLL